MVGHNIIGMKCEWSDREGKGRIMVKWGECARKK